MRLAPLLLLLCVAAAPRFGATFSDRMVIQRDKPVPLHGTAGPGQAVRATVGDDAAEAVAGEDGRWRVTLPARPASDQPVTLTVTAGGETTRLDGVLVGDVWLLSGQSNMQWPVRLVTEVRDDLARRGRQPMIRLLGVKPEQADAPLAVPSLRPPGAWVVVDPELPAVRNGSALGIAFGLDMHAATGVPIGLIDAARGSTFVENWLDGPTLRAHFGGELPTLANVELRPAGFYNAMIAPLRGTPLAGIAWYQGESNSRISSDYGELFAALIEQWRRDFGDPDLPFAFVQLSGFGGVKWDETGDAWAWLREQQAAVEDKPHVAMAVAFDRGEHDGIHPNNKLEVARRLALAARRAGGDATAGEAGPRYESVTFDGDAAVIRFKHVGDGLEARRVEMSRAQGAALGTDPSAIIQPADVIAGFTLAGRDGVFHPATATLDGDAVRVRSEAVAEPVAVRYAWANFALGNLFRRDDGLPLAPFRTDDAPHPAALSR